MNDKKEKIDPLEFALSLNINPTETIFFMNRRSKMDNKIRKAAEKIVETWIALPRMADYKLAIKFVEKEIRKVLPRASRR